MKTAQRIADHCEVASRVIDGLAGMWRAHALPELEERVRRMSLQAQGFRFILRRKDGRVDGHWEHPADIKPGGFDATDLEDEALAAAIYDLQDGHDPA